MRRFPSILALALTACAPLAGAVADLDDLVHYTAYPGGACGPDGCYIEVCVVNGLCFRFAYPTAACLDVAHLPNSVTVGVGDPDRPNGCTVFSVTLVP